MKSNNIFFDKLFSKDNHYALLLFKYEFNKGDLSVGNRTHKEIKEELSTKRWLEGIKVEYSFPKNTLLIWDKV